MCYQADYPTFLSGQGIILIEGMTWISRCSSTYL